MRQAQATRLVNDLVNAAKDLALEHEKGINDQYRKDLEQLLEIKKTRMVGYLVRVI